MTLEQNKEDLEQHLDEFERRVGFTHSVLMDGDVIGCVYIYPCETPWAAQVRSWVRESHADLDQPLCRTVKKWLTDAWDFNGVRYSPRPEVANNAQYLRPFRGSIPPIVN
jgi:hypothetical protein